MKNYISTLLLCLLAWSKANAQGEQNMWALGSAGIDFNGAAPTNYANNMFPADEGSASICNAAGQMLFYSNGLWVWNRNHEIMPELTGGVAGFTTVVSPTIGYPPLMPWTGSMATQGAAIAAKPAHLGKYYLFSLSTNGQLYYSIIDMSLNGGKGGIVSGKKGILLAVGLGEKMTVVKGCNNIWLVTRARTANEYRSFEISDTGIVTTPVVSAVGNLPASWYRCGVIKFSADGQKMAAACNEAWSGKGGLELYDFNPQTGMLSNALVLDSSSTLGYYYGACFSPDNSKLYATTSSLAYGGTFYFGKVHQFDLSFASPALVIASNTTVFTSPVYASDNLGDLKRASNGKIYFGSGTNLMHCIASPNVAGMGCSPQAGVMQFASGSTHRGLPNDIVLLPAPDSITLHKQRTVCYRDSVVLAADSGKWYRWDNGNTVRRRLVKTDGVYVVRFINSACNYETDSIHVRFMRLPAVSTVAYSCPGARQGKAWVKATDTTKFNYRWKNATGNLLQSSWSSRGDTLRGMDTGLHYVQIITPSGCDTTLSVYVSPLPVPHATFAVDSVLCKDIAVTFQNTTTAPIHYWDFGDGNTSSKQNPSYRYGWPGFYKVSLVATNIEGCSDTAYKTIEVRELILNLVASNVSVNRGETVQLQSSASEPYTVSAWEPAWLFSDQSAYKQSVVMDTTRNFMITSVSEHGCKAQASVKVEVNPVVLMPDAFTPNGDGLNDRFHPVSSGYIFVRYFEIYNRWGQRVFVGYGKQALEGWDGTFNGRPQDAGVFFYTINMESKEGTTVAMRGDVTLIR